MANFKICIPRLLGIEGGLVLHKVQGDRGGTTYAGISRVNWPDWEGWIKIDKGEYDDELLQMIYRFYRINFWNKINGNKIDSQEIAYLIFDFSVNAHWKIATRAAQQLLGPKIKADGAIGPKTLGALNKLTQDDQDEEIFILKYHLKRVFYYKNCAWKDKRRKKDKIVSNMKFLPGWVNRVEKSVVF